MKFQSKRYYPVEQYQYPSVTTIIKDVKGDGYGLVLWKMKNTGRAVIEEIRKMATDNEESLISRLELDGTLDDEILKQAMKAPDKESGKAKKIGTLTHEYIEQHMKGERPTITPEIEKPVQAFIQWYEEWKVFPLFVEHKIVSNKYGYAGRTDFIAEMKAPTWRRRRVLIGDFKTSALIYEDMRWQLGAYYKAFHEEKLCKLQGGIIVRLDKETGHPHRKVYSTKDLNKEFKVFKAMVDIFYLTNSWEGKK